MTRPQKMHHRPGCVEPGVTVSRIGGWMLSRCRGCRAVGMERAEEASQ